MTVEGPIGVGKTSLSKEIVKAYQYHLLKEIVIEQLVTDYHAFIEQFEKMHPEISVIRMNGDQLDFAKKPNDLQSVLKIIAKTLQ